MNSRDNQPEISPPQIEYGMSAIAAFFGMPERKAFHLAANGYLPGVFKMGRQWALDKEVGRDGIRSRAGGR
jgi:hypothetical protein